MIEYRQGTLDAEVRWFKRVLDELHRDHERNARKLALAQLRQELANPPARKPRDMEQAIARLDDALDVLVADHMRYQHSENAGVAA